MPVVRWLHRVWNTFWAIIAVIVLTAVIGGGIVFGLIQLEPAKTYLATRIETNFSEKYNGVFTIGELDGLIPFRIELKNVNLYPDSSSVISVFKSDSISANLNVPALFQQRFVVTGLNIKSPEILIDPESDTSLLYALKKKKVQSSEIDTTETKRPFFEILAPNVTITEGEVLIRNAYKPNQFTSNSDSLVIKELDLAMFFEYKQDERFLDIERMSFVADEIELGRSQVFGQIYSDNRFLEFNSFNFINNDSYVNFTGRIDGINIFELDFVKQLREAEYDLDIDEFSVSKDRINALLPELPDFKYPLFVKADFSGGIKEVNVNSTKVEYGSSSINASGKLFNFDKEDPFQYDLTFTDVLLDTSDVKYFFPDVNGYQLQAISNTRLSAGLTGDLEGTEGSFVSEGRRGKISLIGKMGFAEEKTLNVQFETDSLNIGNLVGNFIKTTNITSKGEFKTSDYSDPTSFDLLNFSSSNLEINDTTFSRINISATGRDKIISPKFLVEAREGILEGEGELNFSKEKKSLKLEGRGDNLSLQYFFQSNSLSDVIMDIEYSADFEGTSINDATGVLNVNIPFSTSNGDTLKPQLLYADIANLSSTNRSVRVTTTAADVSLEGNFTISNLLPLTNYWVGFFKERLEEEFFTKPFTEAKIENIQKLNNQDFNITAQLKDVRLLKQYFPAFPDMKASTRLTSNITVDTTRLLFNADLFDTNFEINGFKADSVRTQFTGSFRYKQSLKEFSNLLISADMVRFNTPYFETKGFDFDFDMTRDSLKISNKIKVIGEEAQLVLESTGFLTDTSITTKINDFKLGSDVYSWENKDVPALTFTDSEKLVFEDFTFQNREEFFNIDGAFSDDASDSVNYFFRGVKLDRISDLINGKVDFGGNLNGVFTTRTLTRLPTVEGMINLNAFSLNNQTVGDFEISSVFNKDLNRFDTNVNVTTDSTVYPSYFERNDREGQNLEFSGYVLAPVNGEFPEADSLYHFNLDFNTVDLWIVPFLIPKVFTEMAGVATGSGEVWGNLDTYDFKVDYDIGPEDAVYMKPRFLDTYYYGQGPITFTRAEGLVFKDIFLIDPSGGLAVLDGWYNFNDFQPVHNMDIRIDTEEFQFLNNNFDPTVPFFGKAYGTGVVNISGTNISPVLTTIEPMLISDFSQVELPLLEETEFNEDNKFIRFVSSFDEYGLDSTSSSNNPSFSVNEQIDLSELTFAERFTLDLQFIANNPMTVRLIFDQITGDVITANGTGRLRIRLEDEDLSIFGRFDISDGNYQLVSGDIFTRRFNLESGGSIIWEGEPDNARLNINAVYSARPNIRTLTTSRSDLDLTDPSNIQRTPVDLVLNISGSISSIENNFYFRLPNTFEARQSSTLSTQIASLNRNEDEKLLQATSFLLMGDFIPATSVNGASSLTENFTGSGAVLNPLISNQLISPLLSNQINSLLSSDISSFDIDFNLNTYNQVDLGLALRLYNDRIIIRRDGQLTGAQSNIGDLGATYKINRTFSVTAFHRQDPTFSNLSNGQETQQGQDINGVGVEAEVSFNTWQDFFRRLGSPFRKLFGKNKKEEENNGNENPS
ncbi:MAG: hypothetical protein JJ892_05060 [Balneola sp.]|nr:hypothetical protein [Balneola sp.]MBO6710943.1 hypothetical protein [Balneola sp.]MBO6799630.1 hypothetical protein [Balneola sp.]MBO6870363.1 hypothetical protein [Balneola sp.]